MNKNISTKLELLPAKPGVYLMKNKNEKIIYVGKAKNLKKRVKSYFTKKKADLKTRHLVKRIADIDYTITESETEALILENNLIKKYKPRYNVLLKDDKKYPFISITTDEPFPRIFITRKLDQKARFFGPYTDAKAIKKTLRLLEWIFPFRTCKRDIPAKEIKYKRACLNYQLNKCNAPCIGKIPPKEYNKIIHNVIRFLKGKTEAVIQNLIAEMNQKTKELNYEAAAVLRDRIKDIQKQNNSRYLYFPDTKNRDVIGLAKENKIAAVSVLKILSGKLLNKEVYLLKNVKLSPKKEILSAFLTQYYSKKMKNLPNKILLPFRPANFEDLENILNHKIKIPRRGELKKLIKIAQGNAFNFVEEEKLKHLRKKVRTIFPVKDLKDKLNLKKLPRKIVCLDISTIQGSDTVSSLIFFENGKPKKSNYLHFKIKSFRGQNDYAAMAETLERYFNKIEKYEKPDLMVIDGGKGQLNSAKNIFHKKNIEDIELISLAKRVEEVYLPDKRTSILLPKNSSALRLLIRVRDEAHRFAIKYHKKQRRKRTLTSELDNIPGIGEKNKFLLLKEFGSVTKIKQASKNQLTVVKGIGEKMAENIVGYFSKSNKKAET